MFARKIHKSDEARHTIYVGKIRIALDIINPKRVFFLTENGITKPLIRKKIETPNIPKLKDGNHSGKSRI